MIVIDLYLLFQLMLPGLIRKPTMNAFMRTTSSVVNDTQDSLNALYIDIKYDLTFNGQTMYLEHFLNDQYDSPQRRIYINDVDNDDTLYLFNTSEQNEESYLHNQSENASDVYFINQTESSSTVDFQIFIPSDVIFNEIVLRKQFDRYRLSGPNYEIVIV